MGRGPIHSPLTLVRAAWGDGLGMRFADHPLSPYSRLEVRENVLSGTWSMLAAFAPAGHVLSVLYRVDLLSNGDPEFFVVAALSHNNRLNVTRLFMPLLEAYAMRGGCLSIRVDVHRRGMARKLSALGYMAKDGCTMRKGLCHVL